ncbi:MAG TPA: hypothetical protein VGJ75_05400 [Dongiaceae bacterium]
MPSTIRFARDGQPLTEPLRYPADVRGNPASAIGAIGLWIAMFGSTFDVALGCAGVALIVLAIALGRPAPAPQSLG